MKPIIKLVTLLVLIISSSQGMYAQDLIHKKTGVIIKAKVIEIGSDEIKYHKYASTDNIIYAIEKISIQKVEFENGVVEIYQSKLNDAAVYAGQKNKVFKIDFLSPLRGHTEVTYGAMTKPGRGYELKLGLIGLGKQIEGVKDIGAYFSYSYKLARLPKFSSSNTRRTHILNGAYLRPEIIFGTYSRTDTDGYFDTWGSGSNNNDNDKHRVAYGGVLLNFGKQWFVGNAIVIDTYFGLGYGVDNTDGFLEGIHYGMSTFEDGIGLALSGGLSIGIPFGGK